MKARTRPFCLICVLAASIWTIYLSHEKVIYENDFLSINNPECPEGLIWVKDKINPLVVASKRRIPPMIHVTSRSRCMTKDFAGNLELWRSMPHHSFYFHDEAAMDALLNKEYPEFPHLKLALKCALTGSEKADVWRALLLWEYGGIYTDIDNAPVQFNETTIQDSDDALFLVGRKSIISQYFFAARPRHPLMYLAVYEALKRLLDVNDMARQKPSLVTGPRALSRAFCYFIGDTPVEQGARDTGRNIGECGRVKAGLYTGLDNYTVRIIGNATDSQAIVARNIIEEKVESFRKMNMVHTIAIRQELNEKEANGHDKDVVSCSQFSYSQVPPRKEVSFG